MSDTPTEDQIEAEKQAFIAETATATVTIPFAAAALIITAVSGYAEVAVCQRTSEEEDAAIILLMAAIKLFAERVEAEFDAAEVEESAPDGDA